MRTFLLKCSLAAVFMAILASCQVVKPYQRIYLNDYEMRPGYPGARGFEQYVFTIREGSSGGGGAKTSGGCGCN
ncbi:MAG TPA: DUF4266 domain-containing protein [Cyclobacteriaceae bacterium]|nr:DUF4266 domain-containing protein [Cyclobacteriaceae bacterium]MCB9238305.1 DUF4266 domain-containing protein [Flammeovirgaceae bacterium]MCB0499029.1 DUF4266 domain-containing protein [Cyclobacteriaceae bacterium]MCO5271987.1 DUF4266 domain-containing protein [Cyclobacteriaceae bacterium]MCW5902977.1 DUF4266 domain-containing protein [Cyclobacteriaceae bacterium]